MTGNNALGLRATRASGRITQTVRWRRCRGRISKKCSGSGQYQGTTTIHGGIQSLRAIQIEYWPNGHLWCVGMDCRLGSDAYGGCCNRSRGSIGLGQCGHVCDALWAYGEPTDRQSLYGTNGSRPQRFSNYHSRTSSTRQPGDLERPRRRSALNRITRVTRPTRKTKRRWQFEPRATQLFLRNFRIVDTLPGRYDGQAAWGLDGAGGQAPTEFR